MKALTTTDFHFNGQKSVYHGKVRDVYNINDDLMVMVATDRISAFDVVLPKGIPFRQKSGLREALSILGGVEGIGVVELTKKDIVRHKLVTRIVNAYEAYDKAAESGKKENRLKKDISDESIDND